MKKIISLLLAMLMLISLAVPAFAETDPDTGEKYEIFENFDFGDSDRNARVETDNFILESRWNSKNAVEGGGRGEYVSIYAKENRNLIITRIEARVSTYGSSYVGVGVTAGTKREEGEVPNNSIVHIDNIGESEFAFAEGNDYVYFDMIKVYYEEDSSETDKNCETFGNFDFGNVVGSAKLETGNFILEASRHNEKNVSGGGDGEYIRIKAKEKSGLEIERIEARVSSYGNLYNRVGVTAGTKREEGSVDNGTVVHIDNIRRNEFEFSGGSDWVSFDRVKVYYQKAHEHIWGEDGKCEVCGVLKCEASGEHNAVCSYCGKELSSGNFTGSALSEGNITIVVGIACLAVGLGGGYFIGKKKEN